MGDFLRRIASGGPELEPLTSEQRSIVNALAANPERWSFALGRAHVRALFRENVERALVESAAPGAPYAATCKPEWAWGVHDDYRYAVSRRYGGEAWGRLLLMLCGHGGGDRGYWAWIHRAWCAMVRREAEFARRCYADGSRTETAGHCSMAEDPWILLDAAVEDASGVASVPPLG